jgi:hypothetical protein
VEVLEVVGEGFGGVVGEKGVADAEVGEEVQEGVGGGEESGAVVDGAIEVEGDVADGAQFAEDFRISVDGGIGAKRRGIGDELV